MAGQKRVSIGGPQSAKEYFGDYGNESGKHGGGVGGMTAPEAALDIGNFGKRTLLTGAGWSRNWGGQLAGEIWQALLGHRVIQDNPRLRQLLLQEQSFEEAFAATALEPFTEEDRQAFQQALLDIFGVMDREIARHDHDPWINIYKVQELLFQFWQGKAQGADTGYIFTLNQDLWPERKLFSEHVYGAPKPSLPGLQGRPNQQFFSSVMDIASRDLTMQPVAIPASARLRGNFNVIKLHGSFNWRSAGTQSTLVIGTAKSVQIAASPLLTWYFEIFRAVLSAGSVRLMIVGYGFGDEHVNAVIAEAVERHDLRVFVWDTAPNLRERILAAPYGASIWNGLLSMASRPMIEVFPSNQSETEEYRRIRQTFFK